MTKILLVEDDNNLREIYEARLLAEGYEIINAHDGEEALAIAVKDKPDLIISDIMMPKISGFDMLDILRSTPDIKDTKVIMMTALSQADDKARAERLGADRYLVKSQVTLEDVAKVAAEVIASNDRSKTMAVAAAETTTDPYTNPIQTQTAVTDPQIVQTTATLPVDTTTTQDTTSIALDPQQPISQDQPTIDTSALGFQQTTQPVQINVTAYDQQAATDNGLMSEVTPQPVTVVTDTQPQAPTENPQPTNISIAGKKVIQPISDTLHSGPDLQSLLAKEQMSNSVPVTPEDPVMSPINSVIEPNGQATTPILPQNPDDIIRPS